MGHLPLSYRVDLMKQIGNSRTVQKVLCECCKKACSSFPEEFCAENLLVEVLSEIDSTYSGAYPFTFRQLIRV